MGKKMGYVSPTAIHPGEIVRETIEMLGMSQVDLCARSGISEKTISLIINGKEPITPETALKFERILDLDQKMLVSMQARYWSDESRLKEQSRLETEKKYLVKYSCYKELSILGYVEKTINPIKKIEELLRFFNVNSLNFIPNVMEPSFKISISGNVDNYALASWLRIGEINATKKEVGVFDKEILKNNLVKMRALTKEDPTIFSNQLVELCAEAGVKLILVPHLARTKVNGATYWLSKDNPIIQISLFNKYADIFWFTLFHEIGHILKHGKTESFIDFESIDINKNVNKEKENEADLFAQNILIKDETLYKEFRNKLTPLNMKTNIIEFSRLIDIDPGVVAGRVGKELNLWRFVSGLRKRLVFCKD